jgi:hypothetical protein
LYRSSDARSRERAEAVECLPLFARWFVQSFALLIPALWSPLNQTLPDRLAGIIVVVDE